LQDDVKHALSVYYKLEEKKETPNVES